MRRAIVYEFIARNTHKVLSKQGINFVNSSQPPPSAYLCWPKNVP